MLLLNIVKVPDLLKILLLVLRRVSLFQMKNEKYYGQAKQNYKITHSCFTCLYDSSSLAIYDNQMGHRLKKMAQ